MENWFVLILLSIARISIILAQMDVQVREPVLTINVNVFQDFLVKTVQLFPIAKMIVLEKDFVIQEFANATQAILEKYVNNLYCKFVQIYALEKESAKIKLVFAKMDMKERIAPKKSNALQLTVMEMVIAP